MTGTGVPTPFWAPRPLPMAPSIAKSPEDAVRDGGCPLAPPSTPGARKLPGKPNAGQASAGGRPVGGAGWGRAAPASGMYAASRKPPTNTAREARAVGQRRQKGPEFAARGRQGAGVPLGLQAGGPVLLGPLAHDLGE